LYQQAFLKNEDWIATNRFSINYFQQYLFNTRDHVLAVMKKHVGNSHHELGIAEALLIGYKEDLDKDLVQAYSNTGVVHIIAISGLHLGLIYAVLLWLCNRIPYLKKSRHAKAVLLISFLWLFALLTGGSASVLRSAVMFTVIVAGKYYFKQSSVYNSLAASAFILLCYNPYFLWDVGFQLSYCAVTGIIALQQFFYRKFYVKNWPGRQLWSMVSVTLAAQVGAFPLCIYYFHQFPNLFLFTNLITVPLSTVILFGEILLIIIAPFETIASWLGKIITAAVYFMKSIIVYFNDFSFSLWDNIYANIITTWLLYALVCLLMAWWMNKDKRMLYLGLCCLTLFAALHLRAFIQLQEQQKLVIYNVSRHKAIDFIDQDQFVFTGDSIMMKEGLQQNFHLKPARIALQANRQVNSLPSLQAFNGYYQFHDKKLLFIDSTTILPAGNNPIAIDVLLFSHNPSVDIKEVLTTVRPACIVFDASNSLWKIQKWKSACEELILRCHSVPEEGAFILNIE
jgi:competence protein ComEC